METLAGIVYTLNVGVITTINDGELMADLGAMTCRNLLNKIVVVLEKKGKFQLGKIQNIPMGLFAKFAVEPHEERKIAKLVMDAEQVFLRAYIESDFDRQDLIYKDLDNERERD